MNICTYCGREFQADSDAESLCPQCAAEVNSSRQPEQMPGRFRQMLESPTIILIALNTLVYVLMVIQSHHLNFDFAGSGNLLLNWGANSGALTVTGQWWRLLTSTFEHGGLLHIALNMWCLYNLGWLAELLFGRSRFTLLYLLCGIGGSLGSICWHANVLSVGASGAIFGIAGALIPAMMLHSNPQLRALLKGQLASIAMFVVYNLAFGAALRGTDNAAHVGGLLTGMALGVVFPTGPDRHQARGRLRVAIGTIAMLLVFALAGAYARQHSQSYIELDRASDDHERGNAEAAIAHAQRAVELKPDNAQAQFMLGTLLVNEHRFPEAREAFAATTRLRPEFGPAYVNLCVTERQLQMLTEALASCEQGVRFSGDESESWFNLGRVRYELNDLTGARDALAKAVSINPEGFDENLQYALMLISNHEGAKAVAYLQKAHDLRPQDDGVTKLLRQVQGQ